MVSNWCLNLTQYIVPLLIISFNTSPISYLLWEYFLSPILAGQEDLGHAARRDLLDEFVSSKRFH